MKRTLLMTGGTVLIVSLCMATGWAQMNQTPAPSTSPTPAPATQGPSGQSPAGQAPAAGQPAAPAVPPVDKAEEAAYLAFFNAHGQDPTKQIALGEDFIVKFPASRYLPSVYSALALDYLSSGDSGKMMADAQKAIDLDPDNVDALALTVWATARTVNPNMPGAADTYLKVENYAHHAITLVSTMTKPASMDDAQFTAAKNNDLSMCYSGIGLIHFKEGKYDQSVSELTQAVQLADSPDPVDFFILGHADEAVNRFQDAMDAFSKCNEAGPMVDRCNAGLADAKAKALTAPPQAPAPAMAPAPAPKP
jgi:tetratricopeptide (TPR) repeat protein